MFHGLRYCSFDRVEVANVGGDRETLAPEALDRGLHSCEIFFLAARDRELCTVLSKCPGHTACNSGPAAGHERDLAL